VPESTLNIASKPCGFRQTEILNPEYSLVTRRTLAPCACDARSIGLRGVSGELTVHAARTAKRWQVRGSCRRTRRTLMTCRTLALVLGFILLQASSGRAQTWNIDARTVGLAGIGGEQNIFAAGLAEARGDRSFALPFGLLRLLQQRDRFDPRTADFDPLRMMEFAASPMHIPVSGGTSAEGSAFAQDVRNGTLSRDLNVYRGFIPQSIQATRLVAPRWGRSFDVGPRGGPTTHRVYVGAGPNLALRTAVSLNDAFLDFLSAGGTTYERNQQLAITNDTQGQVALAITGGYRGAFALREGGTFHVMGNVNHLRGLRYEAADLALSLRTDERGLVASGPGDLPLSIVRRTSTSGAGYSLDLGAGIVTGPWEAGFSGQNLGSRMTWRNPTRTTYELRDVTGSSGGFAIGAPVDIDDFRDPLPAAYRANLGFRTALTSLQVEAGREGNVLLLRLGGEQRLGRLGLRGAAAYANDVWQPAAGISVPLTQGLSADAAAFTNVSNVERRRQYSFAASLRLTR